MACQTICTTESIMVWCWPRCGHTSLVTTKHLIQEMFKGTQQQVSNSLRHVKLHCCTYSRAGILPTDFRQRLVQMPLERQERCPTLAQAPGGTSRPPRRPPHPARRPRPPAAARTVGTAPLSAALASSRAARWSWPLEPPHTAAGDSTAVGREMSQIDNYSLDRLSEFNLPETISTGGLCSADSKGPMSQSPWSCAQ